MVLPSIPKVQVQLLCIVVELSTFRLQTNHCKDHLQRATLTSHKHCLRSPGCWANHVSAQASDVGHSWASRSVRAGRLYAKLRGIMNACWGPCAMLAAGTLANNCALAPAEGVYLFDVLTAARPACPCRAPTSRRRWSLESCGFPTCRAS